jgi:hypothetical protein
MTVEGGREKVYGRSSKYAAALENATLAVSLNSFGLRSPPRRDVLIDGLMLLLPYSDVNVAWEEVGVWGSLGVYGGGKSSIFAVFHSYQLDCQKRSMLSISKHKIASTEVYNEWQRQRVRGIIITNRQPSAVPRPTCPSRHFLFSYLDSPISRYRSTRLHTAAVGR